MLKAVIIADDLTGALDSAVAFCATGRRVVVARTVDAIDAAMAMAPDVISVSTQSREGSEEAARLSVRRAAGLLPLPAASIVMKKVDSRLKGHVAAETDEMVSLSSASEVVVAPALPDMDRVVCGGILSGAGIAEGINVSALFDGKLKRAFTVPDATEPADLMRIVGEGTGKTLWVGARGLAGALAEQMVPSAGAMADRLKSRILFAVGSRDPVTKAQVENLRRALPFIEAPDGNFQTNLSWSAADALLISMTDGGTDRPPAEAGALFADGIADSTRRLQPATLLVSGGETADAVLDRLGIDTLTVRSQVRPGVPLCHCTTAWGSLAVVTKSGGFGGATLLRDIAREATVADTQLST